MLKWPGVAASWASTLLKARPAVHEKGKEVSKALGFSGNKNSEQRPAAKGPEVEGVERDL